MVDPVTGAVLAAANTLIGEELASEIQEAGIEMIRIRSVLSCESPRGVCACCYGVTWRPAGWWSADSRSASLRRSRLASRVPQLTMRTFHIGGAASGSEQSIHRSKHAGTVNLEGVPGGAKQAPSKLVAGKSEGRSSS